MHIRILSHRGQSQTQISLMNSVGLYNARVAISSEAQTLFGYRIHINVLKLNRENKALLRKPAGAYDCITTKQFQDRFLSKGRN